MGTVLEDLSKALEGNYYQDPSDMNHVIYFKKNSSIINPRSLGESETFLSAWNPLESRHEQISFSDIKNYNKISEQEYENLKLVEESN